MTLIRHHYVFAVFALLSAFVLLFVPARLLATQTQTQVPAPPKPFTADYHVLRNGEVLGKATIHFAALANGNFELRTDTIGSQGLAAIAGISIKELSVLRWNGEHLETVNYTYKQKIAWKTRERSLEVDASAGRIVSTDKNGSHSLAYKPNVLDRHAVTVAIMQDIAHHKSGTLLYTVPDGDILATQRFQASSSEKIDTALGSQRATRIERLRDSGGGVS